MLFLRIKFFFFFLVLGIPKSVGLDSITGEDSFRRILRGGQKGRLEARKEGWSLCYQAKEFELRVL